MRTRIKEVQGIDWFDGAIMNCIWEGPRLRDILLRAGVKYDNGKQHSSISDLLCIHHSSTVAWSSILQLLFSLLAAII